MTKQSDKEYIANTGLKIVSIEELVSLLKEDQDYCDFRADHNKFIELVEYIKSKGIYIPREILRTVLEFETKSLSYRMQLAKNNTQEMIVLTNRSTHQMECLYRIHKKYVAKGKVVQGFITRYILI